MGKQTIQEVVSKSKNRPNLRHGGQMAEDFSDQVWQNLFKYHWVLPYPSSDRWVYKIIEGKSKTKKGKGKERAIEEEVGGKLLRGKLREKVKGQARKIKRRVWYSIVKGEESEENEESEESEDEESEDEESEVEESAAND